MHKAPTDPKLGQQVHDCLKKFGIETPLKHTDTCSDFNRDVIGGYIIEILNRLGLDLDDDSLHDTPSRVARMYCDEIFSGLNYENFPKCTTVENKMGYDEVVLVRGNIVRSTCEHHLQPIYGKASIAYIPGKRVLGLSKFARIVDFFASRPQVQERLTEQIYAALSYILETKDVAVIIEAEHFCMKMRGVEEYCSDTVTSKMGGRFRTVQPLREEVLLLINGGTKA